MIVALFAGTMEWADFATIDAAMTELIGTGEIDGPTTTRRADDDPRDGALVVVHSGCHAGAAAHANRAALNRGLRPTVIATAHLEHDRAGAGPVPCVCPTDGWLSVSGARYHECWSADRRRNARMVAYLLERDAESGTAVCARLFSAGPDDVDLLDLELRLTRGRRPLDEGDGVSTTMVALQCRCGRQVWGRSYDELGDDPMHPCCRFWMADNGLPRCPACDSSDGARRAWNRRCKERAEEQAKQAAIERRRACLAKNPPPPPPFRTKETP